MNKVRNSFPKVYVPVMGGLGNQLFQVHAAASIAEQTVIYLDEELFGEVTQNSNLDFQRKYRLKGTIKNCTNLKYRWITRRLSGLILRINPYMQNWLLARIAGRTLRILASIAFSARYKTSIQLVAPSSVGFEPIDLSMATPLVLLGYFQSYRYIDQDKIIRKTKFDFNFANSSINEILPVNFEKPLIVHVRLGDYLENQNIGLLDESYYKENLSRVMAESNCSIVWLFSNDAPNALKYIPSELAEKLVVKENADLDESQILDLMSSGHAFFLANSTFSWWAAKLSCASAGNIYAPDPWFSGLIPPIDLIPPDWISVPSKFNLTNS
jgi:hypothetical protein